MSKNGNIAVAVVVAVVLVGGFVFYSNQQAEKRAEIAAAVEECKDNVEPVLNDLNDIKSGWEGPGISFDEVVVILTSSENDWNDLSSSDKSGVCEPLSDKIEEVLDQYSSIKWDWESAIDQCMADYYCQDADPLVYDAIMDPFDDANATVEDANKLLDALGFVG